MRWHATNQPYKTNFIVNYIIYQLYHASKILANNASWDFKRERKPHFDLITIHPTFVYGHDILQTTAEEIRGTNKLLWTALTTGQPTVGAGFVNVTDVATAHVKALDPLIKDGSSYILAAENMTYKKVAQLLHENYADSELFKLTPDTPEPPRRAADGSKAEKELGIRYVSLETTIKEVVDQNVRLTKARV